MRRVFSFGKYAIGSARRINAVTVEVELNDKNVFSACGFVWNGRHTDCIMGGQCLDEIAKYVKTPFFKRIHRLWKLYHLNDMHAGTEAQEEALKGWQAKNRCNWYTEACEYLKSIGLYEDHGYKYGHGWLKREIPAEDLQEIKELLTI